MECLTEQQSKLLYTVVKRGKITKILFGFRIKYQRITVWLYKKKAKIDYDGKQYLFKAHDIKLYFDKCKELVK